MLSHESSHVCQRRRKVLDKLLCISLSFSFLTHIHKPLVVREHKALDLDPLLLEVWPIVSRTLTPAEDGGFAHRRGKQEERGPSSGQWAGCHCRSFQPSRRQSWGRPVQGSHIASGSQSHRGSEKEKREREREREREVCISMVLCMIRIKKFH